MPSELELTNPEGPAKSSAQDHSEKKETDNPKPNGALASDRGREGGTPVGLVALQ